ncbi:hypothetical protein BU17DRAFT_67642 [Hysterangium stoloniferum]|nr:hypothetical protein BU17DRAFT_67642 [Hysterangium stoloniferum]
MLASFDFFCCSHYLPTPHWTIASVIVIGSSAQFKIFINAPGLDSTPTERPVDQSPTGFPKQGPRPEDRRHLQKFERRRKRKQYDRGIQKAHEKLSRTSNSPEDTHSKPREGERDKPKTPTQSPGKEKEKETGSRRNKTIGLADAVQNRDYPASASLFFYRQRFYKSRKIGKTFYGGQPGSSITPRLKRGRVGGGMKGNRDFLTISAKATVRLAKIRFHGSDMLRKGTDCVGYG